ncbi:TetR/AcrR family transcriptional regulator [Shewanella sp. NIFS-20-20]|uniref:TetR/AcrR family transcriptional regulator n=1 Tax=Shewanella sp. NIFS-20-20 TaxID=2853806 RepID=UPI001C483D04|nr:TetR/AcrR family transcriptional regulator [Shewanella sp. NIFS-20-20]MBV7317480.1 TetR/AcrR family transcriptional regulator [Shewanella sp. NIFS-20-20]
MRNAEFDRETVLRSAMTAFMDKGYAKTSMQDLTKATGLHPGSIYCAFDNKRGLLLAALAQYQHDRSLEFSQFFSDSTSTLAALKAYLDHTVAECVSCDAAKACLLTKALNEIAQQDEGIQAIISSNLATWQQHLAAVFDQAKANGELQSQRDSQQLARFLAMGIYGLRTFAHTHPEANTLQELADQLFHDLCA